jgi:Ca-activated chloride channel family protein|tara:strand:+ start:351 stop:1352 length:1002 start_codon:yes stop_codon:yes gene_type:complete
LIKYLSPYCFFLLIPLALIILLNIFYVGNEIKKIKSNNINNYLFSFFSFSKFRFKNWLLILACFFLIIASTGPQVGTRLTELKRQGIDIFIVLDVSKSMNAIDVSPSRLEKAKYELNRLINNLQGDRIGIIVFSGSAHLHLPLTIDYSAAKLFLNSIDTDIISDQGTSLSSALNLALSQIKEDSEKYKVVVLVSDGEDHEGESLKIAEEAFQRNILVYTVGVGTNKGGPIPILNESGDRVDFKKQNNKIVTTTLNEQILNEISSITRSKYYRIDNKANALAPLIKNLESMEKKELKTQVFTEYEHRYQIFLLLSLVCLIVELLIKTKKNKQKI